MKLYLVIAFFCITTIGLSQDITSNYRTKKLALTDTIVVDTLSINPAHFIVKNATGVIKQENYEVDYEKGLLIFKEKPEFPGDSVSIDYLRYPDFITQDYYEINPDVIVESTGGIQKLYSLNESNETNKFTPFEGLSTAGSISRGVTIGNNQNAVVNSQLDLQITGKLSDKVSIRASIQDANIPAQQGGYSQNLDEFDQIFIELYGKDWNIRAGDIDLINNNSYFGRFTKRVQGISLGGAFHNADGSKISAFGSGALVRGVFQRSQFIAEEGNQGPYKLVGPNGELYILIVSGSERVFVNGLLLKRGENEDYVIDYNAGEIRFNPTYPITANMRISVEYQYTDRNYTRFIGYGGGNYSSDKLDLGVFVYSENDAKNQPLQQNLSEEQVSILAAAGDNMDEMVAPSAVPDTFSENKILYRKEIVNGEEIFVFSNNPQDELFNVRFSLVGANLGNYVISTENSINRIFEYIAPVNNVPQGNYAPIIQLNAPVKLQIGGLNGRYHPTEKTNIDFEVAGSKNDLNLFSKLDNEDNDGFATRLAAQQRILTTSDSLRIDALGTLDYLHKDFRTIERLYNIEFNRDWNLENPLGNQRYLTTGVRLFKESLGIVQYDFQNLDYSENFKGLRHVLTSQLRFGKFSLISNNSILDSDSDIRSSEFFRTNNVLAYSFDKAWVGGKINAEDNEIRVIANDSLTPISQRYQSYEVFSGIGDSTKLFVELGYRHQINDSVRNRSLQRVNSSNTLFLKSQVIRTANSNLAIFANYRKLDYTNSSQETEQSLNSRLLYNQLFLKGGIRWNTALETNNGVVPQQEFTYVQVDQGQGIYTWIDYNENGIQELEEFEVAQFQDQAEYIRVLLPNQIFVKTRNNKFSQILTLDPKAWKSETGFKLFLSHFHNQTSYLIDRKVRRKNDDFNIDPFKDAGEDQLGLALNFRNVLFFNRGKQHYTTSYTFINASTSNLIALGIQENRLSSHQLNFTHKVKESWLLNMKGILGTNESNSENFANRNFDLDSYSLNPKVSYLLNNQTRFDVFYEFVNKENSLGEMEALDQQKIGVSFGYNNLQKISLNGEFNYIDNAFSGSAFSPVAYQMLEGLQPGTNFTWSLLLQKKITKFLDVNLSYFGRKSEASNTIHTGTLQLRAYF